jgi:hypothetical protein
VWQREQIGFRLREELCAGDIVTLEVLTPAGTIVMMGEPEDVGRMLVVCEVHSHSEPSHEVGTANLGVIAQALMQRYEYDEIVIKGARRESGLRAGQFARDIRYRRRAEPAV